MELYEDYNDDDLVSMVNDLNAKMDRIEQMIQKADKTIATIAGEVKPTLEALMGNPMLKMFLNKGKDK
jgi:hypothetical protein